MHRNLSFTSLFLKRNVHDPAFDCKGVKEYSPLHDVGDRFSIIWNLPTEEFHLCKEGVAKTIIKRLLEDSTSKTAKEIHARWSEIYERTKVFSETARRTRRIATGDMKGSEFGVVLFSAFPSLVSILDEYRIGHW